MDNDGIDTRRLRLELFTEEALLRLQHRRANALKEYGVIPQRRSRLPEWEILVYPPYPASLYGKPVVEVDHFTLDKAFCVVTRRFSKYYLYRFSATKSLFLFSPWSSIREKAIQISTHRYFDYLVMITILVNCVFLALSSPPEETEYVFLTIYSVEMIIKCIAKGFILNQYTYLRNFWNWLDFIVVLSGYLTLFVPSDGLDVGSLAGLRTFRVLRALKTVSILPGLKTIVNAMLHSIKMLAEVMALTIFCLMVFALLALQLYMGNLRHSCVSTNHTDSENLTLLLEDGVPQLCGNASGARSCPDGFSCYPDVAPNPNFGYTNFDSYGWAILNCLQLITLDYWEDIYNKILEVSGPASIFYFVLVIFLGSFYIVNLTLAVVAICYEEEAANAIRERDKAESMKKAPRMSKIFTKLRDQQSPSVEMARKKIHRRTSRPRPYNNSLTDSEEPPDDSESEIAPHPYRPPLVHHPPPMGAPDLVISAQLHHLQDDPMSSQEESDAESQPVMQIRRSRSRMGNSSVDHARARSLLGAELGESSANEITEDMPQIRGCWENRRDSKDEEDPSNRKTAKLSTRFRACQHAGRNICSWTRKLLIVIVTDPLFDLLITTCILVNTAFLAAEHHGMTKEMQSVLVHGNLVFTIIFSLEAIMKLLALRREYFESKWNIFDLAVVVVSLMDLGLEQVSGLSVLRTFRLLRVLKLAQAWPTMRMLLGIIATTLGAVGNMTLVLSVIVYIFAVLGMQLFAATYTEENFAPDPVPRWNFSDFWHSLLVVFRVLCGEWVQPLWECLQAAPDKKHLCFVVFLSALTVGNFLVLNLFLAMLLNSFNSRELTEREENSKDSKVMAGFRKLRHVLSRRQTSVDNQEPEEEAIKEIRGPPPKQPKIAWEIVKAGHSVIELATLGYEPANISDDDGHPEGTPERNRDSMERRRTEPDDCFPALCYTKFPFLVDPPDWFKQIRLIAFRITEHRVFEWVVLILIFASSILLCFEDVYLPEKPQWQRVLNALNLIFTACFVLEMLLKWFGHGLFTYFSSFWTVMDFVIVNISVLSIALESAGSGLYALRAIRTLRALRPLRAVSRWQGMRIVVNALVSAIPAIFNVLLVCILFWLIFSIMGVQFFGGRFYKCVDDVGERLPLEVVYNRSQCLLLNLTWQNSMINFDNVGNAYLALFQVATFEGWLEIMSDATDSREVDEQPAREANMLAAVYFVVFIICGSFFTLNLFIGVIIDNFNMLKKKYEGGILEMFLTESQKTYYTAMQKLGRKKPQRIISRPKNPLQALFYDVAISRKFEILVFILILLNMLAMSCEHYKQPELLNSVLAGLNIAFTACFCLEAAIKIIGLRQHYFKVPWNVFDLTVVCTSIIGIIFEEVLQTFVISPTLLRVIRLVRIGRVLRLVKAAKGIRKLLFALIISLPALFNIGALLFLVMFIYAIIGMSFFGHVKHTGALTETVNFETFAHSMLLLFRLCTSAGWNDILEPLLVQPPDCDIHYKGLPNGDCGQPVNAIFYLVTYIIINYMVIINMYIAIILENLNQASQEEEMGITEDDIENFYNYWARYDPHATQFIHFGQLSDFVSGLDPPLVIPKPNTLALVAMNLPICHGDNIHCLDVLHGLTRMFLGDVEDTEEFRKLRDQMDQRFLKSFPSRNQVEVISSTYDWKRRERAATVIQKAFRRVRLAKKRDASKSPS